MASKTILVTGGAGFIGSNFIRYWRTRHPEDTIINFDALTYAGRRENLADIEKAQSARYVFVKGDIRDPDAVAQVFRAHMPAVIVNSAAESHNSRAVVNPRIFYETNVLGTQTLLEEARKQGVERFHHISTCEVYGDLALDAEERFTEESPYRPRTPYNSSKAAADMVVRAYGETFGVPYTISNCANNYGPYQFPEKVIPHFTIKALSGDKLPLYTQSKNRREWIHVDDHCSAIDLILQRGRAGETYNVGTGIEADVETIADTVLDTLGLDASLKTYVEDRPGHDRRYLLDSAKIQRELGWVPTHNFEESLRETILWYQAHPEWWRPLLKALAVEEETWAVSTGKKA